MDRQELQATKPKREAFETDEEFEEATQRWLTTAGRNLSLTQPLLGSPQLSALMAAR